MNNLLAAIKAGREGEVLQPYARVNSSAGGVLDDARIGAIQTMTPRRWKRRRRSTRWT